MFNKELAESAKKRLQSAVDKYNKAQEGLVAKATVLHHLRESVGRTVIIDVEAFISRIAEHPKEFDKTIGEFEFSFKNFSEIAKSIADQINAASVKGAAGTGLGVAGGIATVTLAPTAALAIATTFGTASTGTAIASLSGAAATNAALAWLGGGAVAAGGGGMASGGALLALAGPIGWSIAGVAVVGGGVFYAFKNKDIAKNADAKTRVVFEGKKILELSEKFVDLLTEQTTKHADGLKNLLVYAASGLPSHYSKFTNEQLELVGAVLNHVQVLAELMQRTVTEYLRRQDVFDKAKAAADSQRTGFMTEKAPERRQREEAEFAYAEKTLRAYCGGAI